MSKVKFDLTDKVAIVTGGGRGIGREIALGFADAGADVIVTARTLSEVEKVAAEVREHGRKGMAFSVDVSNTQQVAEMVAKVKDEFGKIDILSNNAAISPAYTGAEKLKEEDWDRIMAINLKGMFFTCQTVGKIMIEQKRGKIINTLSIGGLVALPKLVAYCASKGGAVLMTKVLAVEWAKHNVQVNAICPSYVATDFTAGIRANEGLLKEMMKRSPLESMADPEAMVAAAIFLAADASSYVSGATLTVDAGWTAW